jgi:hypothetical protein
LKPALKLGAERLVVIGLTAPWAGEPREEERARPDVFDSVSQAVHAVFADFMAQDLRTLAGRNEDGSGEKVPYIFVTPEHLALADLATAVLGEHYGGLRGLLRNTHLGLLRRAIGGTASPGHAELITQLLFVPEFAEALLRHGAQDARRHGMGWRTGLPERDVRFARSSEPQPAPQTLRS